MIGNTVQISGLTCVIVHDDPAPPSAAVVLCHGFGAAGTDLLPIADEMLRSQPKLENTVFVFPQGPIELDPIYDSRAWWMIDIEKIQLMMARGEIRDLKNDSPPHLSARRKQIGDTIAEICRQYKLRSDQVVVGGFSQGAMLATDVALHYPEQLAGLIVWSGALINERQWSQVASGKSGLKVVQSHGRLDPILPFATAVQLRDMFREHGQQVQFIEFNGQHSIPTTAILAATDLIGSIERTDHGKHSR